MIFLIFQKEMRYALRDTDVLIYALLVPLLIYPVLIIGATEVFLWQLTSPEHRSKVSILDLQHMPAPVLAALQSDKTLEVVSLKDPMAALRAGTVDAVIDLNETPSRLDFLLYTAGRKSFFAVANIEHTVRTAQSRIQTTALRERGLPSSVLTVYALNQKRLLPGIRTVSGHANVEAGASSLPATGLALLGLIQASLSAGIAAVCMLAEEKEKNSFETTVTLPVQRWWLIAGKWLAVTTIALFSAICNIVTLSASFIVVLAQTLSIKKISWQYLFVSLSSLDPWSGFYAFFAIVVGCAVCAAFCMACVSFCRNFKDGQAIASYPMLIAITLPMLALAPGIEKHWWTVLVPIANVLICVKHPQSSGLLFLESLVLSIICVAPCLWLSERVYFNDSAFSGAASDGAARLTHAQAETV